MLFQRDLKIRELGLELGNQSHVKSLASRVEEAMAEVSVYRETSLEANRQKEVLETAFKSKCDDLDEVCDVCVCVHSMAQLTPNHMQVRRAYNRCVLQRGGEQDRTRAACRLCQLVLDMVMMPHEMSCIYSARTHAHICFGF